MQSDEMLNELEANFGLRDNHIKILKELQLSGSMTADNLAKNTGIPLGRIYDFLNDLIECKLINKSTTFPSIYSIDSMEERVMDFMRYQTENLIKKEQKLSSLLREEKEVEQTSLITDREQLAFETMKSTMESKEIKSIVKTETIPTILYPFDEQEFVKLRTYFAKKTGDKGAIFKGGIDQTRVLLYRTAKEAYKQKKKFIYLMDEHSVNHYLNLLNGLGKERKNAVLEAIKKQISEYKNVKVYVTKENTPLAIRICDGKRLLLRFVHLNLPIGVVTKSQKVASFYNKYFDSLVAKSKPIKYYLG